MLLQLEIQNFVLVNSLNLEIGSGLVAITGESGAGKSALISALKLCLGQKVKLESHHLSSQATRLAATFKLSKASALLFSKALDVPYQAGDRVCLTRVSNPKAKSAGLKSFIDGKPCTLALLQTLGESLLQMQGQGAGFRLAKATLQRQLLDRFALASVEKSKRGLWAEVRLAYQAYDALSKLAQDKATQETLLKERLNTLEGYLEQSAKLNLEPREVLKVVEEFERLSNQNDNAEKMASALYLLESEEAGLLSQIGQTHLMISGLKGMDWSESSLEALEESKALLGEVQRQIQSAMDTGEVSQQHYHRISEEANALLQLSFQSKVPLEQLQAWQEGLENEQEATKEKLLALEGLEEKLLAAKARYDKAANALSQVRALSALALAKEVNASLGLLEMQDSQVQFVLEQGPPSLNGQDQIVLMLEHKGKPGAPVAQIASGGELSRISLALYVALYQASEGPQSEFDEEDDSEKRMFQAGAMVFDEADSGTGGKAALGVASLLKRLTERGVQVFCITHQASVAALADTHLLVSKTRDEKGAFSQAFSLDRKMREKEIARMIGGDEASALRHASSMLQSSKDA